MLLLRSAPTFEVLRHYDLDSIHRPALTSVHLDGVMDSMVRLPPRMIPPLEANNSASTSRSQLQVQMPGTHLISSGFIFTSRPKLPSSVTPGVFLRFTSGT